MAKKDAGKKMRRLNKLEGVIPMMYRRDTIYSLCIWINALVDAVNYLAGELESMREEE